MNVIETDLPDVKIIEPAVHGDGRGFFMETYQKQRYQAAGIDVDFVQDNLSMSHKGVLRGLHYQYPHPQGKLVQVLSGEVFDVAVDIRKGSQTFGKWVSVILSADNKKQFYMPPGFAHGFCTLADNTIFSYKCSDFYYPEYDHSILWNDPDIGIDWPLEPESLSNKDQNAIKLADL